MTTPQIHDRLLWSARWNGQPADPTIHIVAFTAEEAMAYAKTERGCSPDSIRRVCDVLATVECGVVRGMVMA